MSKKEKKSYENTNIAITDSTRVKVLMRASFLAMGVDVLLVLIKYGLARITGNGVLLADTLHSTADFAVSFMVLLSILVNYTFQGSRRAKYAEAFAAFLISLLLIFGSLQMFRYIWANKPGSFILMADISLVIAFAGISLILLITLKMSVFKKKTGEKYQSDAFSAEGVHTFSDFLSSVSVWITLLLGYFGLHIERIITFLIGLAVLNIGLKLFIKSMRLFGIRLKFLTKLSEKIHTDILRKIRSIKDRNKKISVFLNSKAAALPNLIRKDIKIWIYINIALILILYIGTGFYKVLPYQTGLELLFGRVAEKNPPGPHFHAPAPFGKAVTVDTSVMVRLESGFRTDMNYSGREPDMYLWENMHNEGRYTKIQDEALTIAGDENLIDIHFICYYQITDPVQYALNIEDAHETLRNVLVYEIHAMCGYYKLDDLLSFNRGKIQEDLLERMKIAAGNLSMGVEIKKIYMQEAHPPIEVVPQYRNISSAREKKDEIIHLASAYANDLVPRSRGEASAILSDSDAYAEEKVDEATGQAESFNLKQDYFKQNRNIQKIRLWWETTEKIFKDKLIYILPSSAKRRFLNSDNKTAKGK